MTEKKPLDFLGREIRVGDVCIYPVRRGSKMWLHRVSIKKILFDPSGEPILRGEREDGYIVRINSLERVVILGRGSVPSLE